MLLIPLLDPLKKESPLFIFVENLDFGFDYILRMRIKIIYGIRQRPPESSGGKAFMSVRGQKKLEMGGGAYLASE